MPPISIGGGMVGAYKRNLYNHVKSIVFKMAAIKGIPVSPEILEELSRLKEPEQTFGELIAGMIEREKKFRLLKDMKRIEETAEFVEI
ncbi:hypothetical protein C5S53_13600 [Methanophagales archaeon]|nr:hypothetical protein C5S53_13600 [Methanophagales archaeon]